MILSHRPRLIDLPPKRQKVIMSCDHVLQATLEREANVSDR